MAAILGNVNKLYVKIGNATNYTWLTGEQSNSVNRTQEAIEVSDKSTEWAQFIGGKKGATIDATIFADNADAAQQESASWEREKTPPRRAARSAWRSLPPSATPTTSAR